MMRGQIDIEWIALGLQAQVRTLSGQIALLDAHVELLLDKLAESQAPRAPVEARCDHPEELRLEAGSMRAPLRYFCKVCRRFIDPAQPEGTPAGSPAAVSPS
ncbi:MAG TPA: hypothetical protein VFQ26_01240 [Nitrospiraceae bacterium]|nr:hypothetical protein [Nitrospiraceae bacterium]